MAGDCNNTRFSASALDNILGMRILPQTSGIASINLCTQFVSYWDADYRLVELNDSLFFDGMNDHEGGKCKAVNRFIFDYMPDLEDIGAWEEIRQINAGGGRLSIPNYRFKGFNLNGSVRCTVFVAKLDDYVVITGEHVTYDEESFDCPRLRDLRYENDRLSRTVDVLIKRFAELKQANEDAVRANIETEIIPLISSLESTQLDEQQAFTVSSIRQSLESITDGYNALVEKPEYGLSFREREVAALVHRGKTAKEIAATLGISKRTVESHKASIQRKMRDAK